MVCILKLLQFEIPRDAKTIRVKNLVFHLQTCAANCGTHHLGFSRQIQQNFIFTTQHGVSHLQKVVMGRVMRTQVRRNTQRSDDPSATRRNKRNQIQRLSLVLPGQTVISVILQLVRSFNSNSTSNFIVLKVTGLTKGLL